MVLASTMAMAQQVVTGKVTAGEDGSPIPGVNVLEKGTSNGTVTDVDGNYRITVGSNATLAFSFVGYQTQEMQVAGQSTVNPVLQSDVTSLSEVVVVGYGSQDKKEVTSATISVKSESFNKGNINDPAQLLQGKAAGVVVTKPGSDPNEGFNIRIRGITSAGSVSPLVVIDGVIGASLSNVDPNDIASFDVLKDGSAAAIYGTRGSAGVILVTTKKGKAGKTQVDFNSFVAIDKIAKSVPVMGRDEYVQVPGATDLGSNTDWVKEVTRTGVSKVNNLGLSGGSGNTTYRFSLNWRDVEGILKKSGFDQINGRFSLQQSAFNNRLRLNFDMANTSRESKLGFQEALRYAVIRNPTAPIYDASAAGKQYGGYAEQTLFDNYNPVSIINQNWNNKKANTINLSGKIDFDIIKGLTGTISYATQKENFVTDQYYAKTAYFRGTNRNGLAIRNEDNTKFQLFEGFGNYTTQVGDLNLTALAGYSYQQTNTEGFGLTTGNFLTDAVGDNRLDYSQDVQKGIASLTSYKSPDYKIIAGFGRVNLNYKETYLLSGSVRREGSTRFGEGHKWGTFGSASGAVVLTNLVEIPSVNSLKVRAGWGRTGALPNGNGYSQTQFSQNGSYGISNGVYIPVVTTSLAPNPSLGWETKTEINAGLDFALLSSRLTGSFEVYQRDAKDFIQNKAIDAATHVASNQYQNFGEVKTNGVELTLGYAVIQKGLFTWNTSLVASHYLSKFVHLNGGSADETGFYDTSTNPSPALGAPGQNSTYMTFEKAGGRVGDIYGPKFLGVNADGTNNLSAPETLGHGLPSVDLGWTNTFTYGNWDLNFFLRSTLGHSLVNSYRAFYEPVVSGQTSSYNRVKTKYYDPSITTPNFSSYYVEKGDFVRLDNAQLGYNFKTTGTSISRFRIYVSGNNLFVITKYTGVDPEARLEDKGSSDNGNFLATTANPFVAGIDRRSTYFRARTVTLGVNLTF